MKAFLCEHTISGKCNREPTCTEHCAYFDKGSKMTDENAPPEIPTPYELAVDLVHIRDRLNSADPRTRVYVNIGLMLFWAASEINNLVEILQPNVPLQNEAEAVPSEGPPEDAESAEGRPMDADAERQIEGSD